MGIRPLVNGVRDSGPADPMNPQSNPNRVLSRFRMGMSWSGRRPCYPPWLRDRYLAAGVRVKWLRPKHRTLRDHRTR